MDNLYLVILWEENRLPYVYNIVKEDNIPQVKAQMKVNETHKFSENVYLLENDILFKYFTDINIDSTKKLIFHKFDNKDTIHEIICYYDDSNNYYQLNEDFVIR